MAKRTRRVTASNTPSHASRRSAVAGFDEEEVSLLPLQEERMESGSQAIPPSPEEANVPMSRLVIHKMVLVNFKSYAGRQEIGPFHKVCLKVYHVRLIIDCALVLLCYRWPEWLRKVKYY